MSERTLVLVKPDGVARGLVGEVLGRIERKGFRLVAVELRTLRARPPRRTTPSTPRSRSSGRCRLHHERPPAGRGRRGPRRHRVLAHDDGRHEPGHAAPGTIRGDLATDGARSRVDRVGGPHHRAPGHDHVGALDDRSQEGRARDEVDERPRRRACRRAPRSGPRPSRAEAYGAPRPPGRTLCARSGRATSPTSPRATPSGLTRTRVRSGTGAPGGSGPGGPDGPGTLTHGFGREQSALKPWGPQRRSSVSSRGPRCRARRTP